MAIEEKKRKNIGLYLGDTEDIISGAICQGAMRAARENDVNLFIFPGGMVAPDKYYDEVKDFTRKCDPQNNILFGISDGFGLDAAILAMDHICASSIAESKEWLHSLFADIPTIVIGDDKEHANIRFQNATGIKKAVKFLVEEKNCTKIAFMSGDLTCYDGIERLNAYKEALAENNIPLNEEYIGYGDFSRKCYDEITDLFNRAYDMEALICANDNMALTAYLEASNRGFKVGTDLFIVGYDNIAQCISANPPLSSVNADNDKLGYEAVCCCLKEGFIENNEIFVIDTEFIPRESVGTKAEGLSDIITSISMLNQNMIEKDQLCAQMCNYSFAKDIRDYQGQCQKTILNGFYDRLISHFFLNTIKRNSEEEIYNYFADMIERDLLSYAEARRITDLFDVFYQAFCGKSRVLHNRMVLHTLISRMEHKVMEWVTDNSNRQELRYEDMLHLTNDITRDILNFDDEAEKNYASSLEKIQSLNINYSILCVYDNPVACADPRQFSAPYSLLIKAYQDKDEVVRINRTSQRVVFDELYKHPVIDDGKRHTYMVVDLFSMNDQLGLYLFEVTPKNMIYREFLTYQLSSAIKMIKLFNQQKQALDAYESIVEKIKVENEELLEASTIDVLTGILNRRGFFEEVQDIIIRKKDQNGFFIVAYADLDYLKQINDNYGHEEGDFALRKTAEILSNTFGEFSIVGRIGGDEYAAFAYQKKSNQSVMFKNRLQVVLDKENERLDKPYKISISMGIIEFDANEYSDIDAMIGEVDDLLYEEKREKHKFDSGFPFTRSRVKILT